MIFFFFFGSKNISLNFNFKPWRFTIYSKKLILIRKKFRRSVPLRKEWQKSVKTSLVFFLEKTFLELWDICLSRDEYNNLISNVCNSFRAWNWKYGWKRGAYTVNGETLAYRFPVLKVVICAEFLFIWNSRHWR